MKKLSLPGNWHGIDCTSYVSFAAFFMISELVVKAFRLVNVLLNKCIYSYSLSKFYSFSNHNYTDAE